MNKNLFPLFPVSRKSSNDVFDGFRFFGKVQAVCLEVSGVSERFKQRV